MLEAKLDLGDVVVQVAPANLLDFFKILKFDTDFSFNVLLDITAVDWLDQKAQRFELVYQLLSIPSLRRIRVHAALPEDQPEVESLCPLWSSANFLEREVWDMYGIRFRGHPNLKRILMYEEFKGHPLRKDYPLQGKQPRIKMRHPEVENTARQMLRPGLSEADLVNITPRADIEKAPQESTE